MIMAYLKKPDEEQNFNPQAPIGGSSGFLGGNPGGGGVVQSKEYAPTSSGARFVNLSRYLEQNPLGGTVQKIGNKTNEVLDKENANYQNAIKPTVDYMNNPDNMKYHSAKTNNDAGFLVDLNDRKRRIADDPTAYDDLLNSRSAQLPNATWSLNPESADKMKSLSNINTLAPELASDRARYTPGMMALDNALYTTGNEVKGAIDKIPVQFDQFGKDKAAGIADINKRAGQWRKEEDDTRDATLGYLRNQWDDAVRRSNAPFDPSGQFNFDETGREQNTWKNIGNLLGRDPNDIKFKPQPWETTPEGKKEAEQQKKDEAEAKREVKRQQKLPNAAKIKISQIESGAERQRRNGGGNYSARGIGGNNYKNNSTNSFPSLFGKGDDDDETLYGPGGVIISGNGYTAEY